MLRLRSSMLTRIFSFSAACPIFPQHRLLSTAAAPVPPNPSFAAEEYLVNTCGLSRAQALKASPKVSHLKSPTKPDAVLAFLAGLGLSPADLAAAVAKDPRLLCAKLEKTLASNVAGLTGLGLSRSEVTRLFSLAPYRIRHRSIISKMQYHLLIFGSLENFLRALKFNANLLTCNIDRVIKPNVAILQECGLGDCDIAKLVTVMPWFLTTNLERLRLMVVCAEGLGVPRGSVMFRHALRAVGFLTEEKIRAKVEYLKNTFKWSDAEVRFAVCRFPCVLSKPKEALQRRSDFFFCEVGLEPAYIAHRPVMLSLSLEGRLRPRYYVLEFLMENGLLDRDRNYYSAVALTEKAFMEKLICPHKEAAPYLAEDYAAACRGETPTRFRFT